MRAVLGGGRGGDPPVGRADHDRGALGRHMSFSRSFRRPPPNPKEHLISAMRQLMRRSLESASPRAMRSTPSSPDRGGSGDGGRGGVVGRQPLARSGSCFSSIGG
ncbi:uncharacterized protein M6B38_230575 [Iris pallida]|uniref:Uncharacterized protein n=1 Tax=Iris pallida TaxID=29817 RepID=A0AAX6DSV0_IRIPA|nr:uncharacterized protein M6B38_230575 [Iris pallida]